MLSEFDRGSIGKILHNTDTGKYDWFTACLLRLIAHADWDNRIKLAVSFPEEVRLVCEYLGQQVPQEAISKE